MRAPTRDRTPGIGLQVARGFAIAAGAIAVPWAALTCAVAAYIGFTIVEVAVTAVDAAFNTHPFSPGRWESADGQYWVQLDDDGTGIVRLPVQPPGSTGAECADASQVVETSVKWAMSRDMGSGDPWASVTSTGTCAGWHPIVRAGGAGYGGHDWESMFYAFYDLDAVDLRLHKVEEAGT